MNLSKIALAYLKVLGIQQVSEEEKELAKERFEFCRACPQMVYSSLAHYTNGQEHTEYSDFKCSKCGCHLSAKLITKESECPIGLWDKEN